jgi:hypothetical protein
MTVSPRMNFSGSSAIVGQFRKTSVHSKGTDFEALELQAF